MQDTIILGNGTSKQIKTASLPDSYAEFKAMAENGSLFADISLNADGCEVVGTPLNKQNLLRDETSEKLNGVQNVDEALLQMLSIIPIGTVLPNASSIVPEKWLLCDGSEVSRETYSDLFNAIGEIYGVGDGSTTFNLPDMRYRVPIGEVSDVGTLHSQSNANVTYLRIIPSARLFDYAVGDTIEYNGETRTITAISRSKTYHQFTINSAFGVVLTTGTEVIFKKKIGSTGGSSTHTLTVDEIPAHSHTYNSTPSNWVNVGDAFETHRNYSLSTATTGSTGGGQPHNIMQPYIVMNYIIYAGV